MKKLFGLIFLIAWAAGETPRLFWKEVLPIRPMDVAVALLVAADMTGRIRAIRWGKAVSVLPAIILVGSWVLGLRMWSAAEAFPGLLYLVRTLVYFWLVWRAKEILGEAGPWIPAAMAVFVILGLGQYLFLPDARFLLHYGWDEHYYRLVGTVLDPNYMGAMAGMIFLFALPMVSVPLALLPLAALVLTWSRASWAAVLVSGIWYLASGGRQWRREVGIVGRLGFLGILVWWAAPKPGGEGVNLLRAASINQRLASWNEAVSVWKEHPWAGVGFNNYAAASGIFSGGNHAANAPSSSWLLLLATLGVLGILGILGGLRGRKRGAEGKRFWGAMFLMIGVHAAFNNTLFYPPVLALAAMIKAARTRRGFRWFRFRPGRRQ